jgi:FlaG/FlaF family flagellin (archaellin)
MRRSTTDDRGVSTTLSYVLTLSITTLLLAGLLIATGGYVDDRREQIVRSQLEVVGQQTAASIEAADHLNSTTVGDDDPAVRVSRTLPERIARTGYTIAIRDAPPEVVVSADTRNLEVVVTVPVVVEASGGVRPVSVQGGDIVVEYDFDGGNELVVNSDA